MSQQRGDGANPSDPGSLSANYGQVGITGVDDLERNLPAGFRTVQQRARLGHGQPRYDQAVLALRTWGAHRHAGPNLEVFPAADGPVYTPVRFDESTPVERSSYEPPADFAPEGGPLLAPGDTVVEHISLLGRTIASPLRVLAVDDGDGAVEVTFGSLEGAPLIREERILVTIGDDGAVHGEVRGVAAPSASWTKLAWPLVAPALERLHTEYLTGLTR